MAKNPDYNPRTSDFPMSVDKEKFLPRIRISDLRRTKKSLKRLVGKELRRKQILNRLLEENRQLADQLAFLKQENEMRS